MKTKIKIEVEIDMADYDQLKFVLSDIAHYICLGNQTRKTFYRKAEYFYQVDVPVRLGAQILYKKDKIIFIHKSKIK